MLMSITIKHKPINNVFVFREHPPAGSLHAAAPGRAERERGEYVRWQTAAQPQIQVHRHWSVPYNAGIWVPFH